MRKIILLLCLLCSNYYVNAQVCNTPYHIVVIGSSTAAGMGATPNHGWVALYTQYLKGININYQVDNLAVGGYTTYDLCPTGFVPPPSRPLPDTNHNITRALLLHPDAIIINLPTNDVGRDYTLTEQQDNYKRMISAATAQGVQVWVTTTQPRNAYNAGQIAALKTMRDWTISYFGNKAIDFWTDLTEPNDSIRHIYSYGDGIHLNDAGHQLLYTRVVSSNIRDVLCNAGSSVNPFHLTSFAVNQVQNKLYLIWYTNNEKNTSRIIIEHSADSLSWNTVGTLTAAGNYTGSRFYSFIDTSIYLSAQYYRLNMVTTDSRHFFSTVIKGLPDTMYTNPFRLDVFTVALQQNKYLLSWTTRAEKNTNMFTIERSTDSLTWNSIGNVNAAGNSVTIRSYSFTDTATRITAAWYRLNMSTHDNRHFYSQGIKSLSPGPDTVPVSNPFNLTTFSVNQYHDQLHLNWATSNEANSSLFIIARSSDSLNWNNIGSITAAGSYPGQRSYNYPDTTIRTNAQYYRLEMVTLDNRHFFSAAIKGTPDTMYSRPFRLATFALTLQQGKFVFNWSTSAEANTYQFIIERSTDSLSWNNTGTIGAAGNSNTIRSYNFTDTATLTTNVYYRLNMVTHDNRHFYSGSLKGVMSLLPLRGLQRGSYNASFHSGTLKPIALLIVPNPAQESCRISGLATGHHLVKVYDMSGRLVYFNRQFQMGSSIAVGAWANGLYILIVDEGKQPLKLIKE
ncbi:putative secreted protein (Por secretion system target) [Chitinophaga niastensis]|uniref:Putative secreted protein (Por secretion system target) n=1 Tax=Chitinophaga niastensis TaxID=536980 RepID=A0A2P8HHK0_CHINA|nr:SGNH/GDSL hydrolase family protein [Chitinophaga niastensis]PSL45671.1 putative secreted protein (Por secretion system target) [Chitinophaga niastensis]